MIIKEIKMMIMIIMKTKKAKTKME